MSSEFFDGSHSRRRARDKLEQVICWLALFDYADRPTLARMLGVTTEGQGAFFQRLATTGFVRLVPVPGMRRELFTLTDQGYQYASLRLPHLILKRRKRLPQWIYLVHSLSIQAAVLNRGVTSVDGLVTEKAMGELKASHVPDAILTTGEDRVALEVELSQKSTQRIYHIFLAHLSNISAGHYSRVAYVFASESLATSYRDRFRASPWPIYRYDAHHKLALDASRTFDASSVISRDVMTFTVEALYDL